VAKVETIKFKNLSTGLVWEVEAGTAQAKRMAEERDPDDRPVYKAVGKGSRRTPDRKTERVATVTTGAADPDPEDNGDEDPETGNAEDQDPGEGNPDKDGQDDGAGEDDGADQDPAASTEPDPVPEDKPRGRGRR